MAFHVPEQHRIIKGTGPLVSSTADGNNGAFGFRVGDSQLFVIASDGDGWEHVSVTVWNGKRCPTWEEMHLMKRMFWDDEDCVVQYHPPKEDYVSLHPYCLHMWRQVGAEFPRPPSIMVGVNL